jgi:hypothetical protein
MSPFAYWDGEDHSVISDFSAEWCGAFPDFRIYGDRDIVPLVELYFPEHLDVYRSIRIPAAKADIARLLMLYHCGGLYIDCHVGIRDSTAVRQLLLSLRDVEVILIERGQIAKPRPVGEHWFNNGIIFSRPHSLLIKVIARQAFHNLSRHREFERLVGHIPYHIGSLSGPGLLTNMVLQPNSNNRGIRADYAGRIKIVAEEVAPLQRDRHRTYGGLGRHWSERQNVELLFD